MIAEYQADQNQCNPGCMHIALREWMEGTGQHLISMEAENFPVSFRLCSY